MKKINELGCCSYSFVAELQLLFQNQQKEYNHNRNKNNKDYHPYFSRYVLNPQYALDHLLHIEITSKQDTSLLHFNSCDKINF